MNTVTQIDIQSRFYQLTMATLLVAGWLAVIADRGLEASLNWEPRSPKPSIVRVGNSSEMPLIRQEVESGRPRMVVAADRILLTDRNRPRVSQALSEIINPQLSAFTAHQKRWRVLLEHGPSVPETHLAALERYYRTYKRYSPQRTSRQELGQRVNLVIEVLQ